MQHQAPPLLHTTASPCSPPPPACSRCRTLPERSSPLARFCRRKIGKRHRIERRVGAVFGQVEELGEGVNHRDLQAQPAGASSPRRWLHHLSHRAAQGRPQEGAGDRESQNAAHGFRFEDKAAGPGGRVAERRRRRRDTESGTTQCVRPHTACALILRHLSRI